MQAIGIVLVAALGLVASHPATIERRQFRRYVNDGTMCYRGGFGKPVKYTDYYTPCWEYSEDKNRWHCYEHDPDYEGHQCPSWTVPYHDKDNH